ncbi:MAG: complex I NDUFA9 subunit family protein [Burkholderiales bacterium]
MKINSVCVLGGAGFLGRQVVRRLAEHGIRVRVPTRHRERCKGLLVLPTVEVVNADVLDAQTLHGLLLETDAVINLVGILHEQRPGEFLRVHAELPRQIVAACRDRQVFRLLHVSALKASHGAPSAYLRSKAEGEQQIRAGQAAGILTTIFRPSVMFGKEDRFLNLFAQLAGALPVIALACPHSKLQPVWVENVAQAIIGSLENPGSFQASYDLCGPRVYSLRELVEFAASVIGRDPRVVPLNRPLSYLQACFMEFLPGKLMTRDNFRSLQSDNVCDGSLPSTSEWSPDPMESVVSQYLAPVSARARYREFRIRAGR